MNILQLLPELNAGGVETGTVDLVKELSRGGHKAVVISAGGRLVDEVLKNGGIHYTLPVDKKSPFTIIGMIGKIRQIITREKIDVVHARSRVPALASFFAAHQAKVPFITTCHGYYSMHMFSRVMGWGKIVIVPSNIIARHMIKNFGVGHDRIRLIHRGVDLDKFTYHTPYTGTAKKEYTIGIVSRITPIKGHIVLIRALSKVVRLMPNVKVLVIGEAPAAKPKYRQELEIMIRRLSLSRYVQFLGERQDIPQQLSKLDMLVFPSIGEETFGRVIVEAQASGVPVIASKVGGVVDIIKDQENGILIPPGDWSQLSLAILRMIKDKELRERLSKNGRLNVERHFTLEHMYKKTIGVYQEAMRSFRVLIIKYSALGDIILSLPALHAVREQFPHAHISMLTSKEARQLLNRYPYINEFVIYREQKGLRGIRELMRVSAELRRGFFDLVVDLQNNKKSHIISFLSFTPRRVGYRSGKFDFLLNERLDGARDKIPPVKHQFRLLRLIGIQGPPSHPGILISEDELKFTDNILTEAWVGEKEILVGINCGASMRWQTKRWPAERLARLCDLLAEKKIRMVITGTNDDRPEVMRLLCKAHTKPIDLVGKTSLMQLAAVIQRCKVFVSGDSAPVHLAVSLGIPTVVLFGPTDPKRHFEFINRHRIIQKRLNCVPCYRSRCNRKACMTKITAEEVAAAVFDLLEEKEAS